MATFPWKINNNVTYPRSLLEASADEGYRQQVEDHRRRAQFCRRDGCQGEGS